MIKYISSKGCMFKFDKDSESIEPIKEIDWYMGRENYFILEEDGEINGEIVHSGDVIMTILDGKAMFKVPDNAANIIKDRVANLNKNKEERELRSHGDNVPECD